MKDLKHFADTALRELEEMHINPQPNHDWDLRTLMADTVFDAKAAHCLKDFFPSRLAAGTCLYLQSIADVEYGPSYYVERPGGEDALRSYLLTQTIEGSGELLYQGKRYSLEEGDIFLIDCRKAHRYQTGKGSASWRYRWAHFDGYPMDEWFHQVLESGSVSFHFEEPDFDAKFSSLFTLNSREEPPAKAEFLSHNLLSEMMTLILLSLPNFAAKPMPEKYKRLCDYLAEHCAEELNLDTLSDTFYVSKYHLSHEFKRYTGQTIFTYITEARLALARRLLRYTDLSIADITYKVGFEDQSSFSRLFHRREGIPPASYRKRWKGV
jgi:AraC-like DNA-binding protein